MTALLHRLRSSRSWSACVLGPLGLLALIASAATAQPLQPEDRALRDAPGDTGAPEAASELHAWIAAGMGATQRMIEFRSVAGPRTLDTSMVPAADLRLRGAYAAGSLIVDIDLRYQTSMWAEARQQPPISIGNSTGMRSHRVEGGVAPGIRFGDDAQSVSLSAFAGYGLRSFSSVEELQVPRFTLHGPIFRLDLRVPIAGIVQLRLAPELQLIAALTPKLRDAGNLDSQGTALGAEAALAVSVLDWLSIELSYRESHASVGSAWEDEFSDVERYVVLDALIRYF